MFKIIFLSRLFRNGICRRKIETGSLSHLALMSSTQNEMNENCVIMDNLKYVQPT